MSHSQKLRSGQQAGFQRMLQKQLSPAGAFLQKQLVLATAVDETNEQRLEGFTLSQNYPNPFNPSTTIHFSLPQREHVTLQVFDVNGREVATLVDSEMAAGNQAVTFAPRETTTGLYFYKLTAGKFSQTRKAVLLK
jgi:hypothetical protein